MKRKVTVPRMDETIHPHVDTATFSYITIKQPQLPVFP